MRALDVSESVPVTLGGAEPIPASTPAPVRARAPAPQLPLCDVAEEIAERLLSRRDTELRKLLNRCESPVEQILLAALHSRWDARTSPDFKRLYAHLGHQPGWSGILCVVVEPQRQIHTETASYRANLFAYVTRSTLTADAPIWGATVIEVDGHEFHERTRVQATRDRRRDRDMLLGGMRVLRFTGSEVFRHPFACADEIDLLLCQSAQETIEQHRNMGRVNDPIY